MHGSEALICSLLMCLLEALPDQECGSDAVICSVLSTFWKHSLTKNVGAMQ